MKVSDLLEKLDIPLNLIRLIGEKTNVEIKKEDQRLSSIEMKKIERLTSTDDFPEVVIKIKANYHKTIKQAYSDEKEHYFFGCIKWFSDPEGIKNYGFATIENFGDVYFQRRDINPTDPQKIEAGSRVIIHVPNDKISLSKRKKASRINFWDDEENISALVYFKIYDQIPSDLEKAFDCLIVDRLLNLNKNNLTLLSLYIENIPSERFNPDQLDFYRNLYEVCHKNLAESAFFRNIKQDKKYKVWLKDSNLISFEEIKEQLKIQLISKEQIIENLNAFDSIELKSIFEETLVDLKNQNGSDKDFLILLLNSLNHDIFLSLKDVPEKVLFKLWKDELYEVSVKSILKSLRNVIVNQSEEIPKAFFKESKENQENVFEFVLDSLIEKQSHQGISVLPYFLTLFERAKTLNIELFVKGVDDYIVHKLWRKEFVDKAVVSEIYKEYLKIFQESVDETETEISESIRLEYPDDWQRLTNDKISNLLIVHFYNLDSIDQNDYKFFQMLLEFEISKSQREILIDTIAKKADGYGKLRLFIDNHTQTVDFDDAVLYTAFLNSEDQKLFFKKCLSLVEQGEANWSISDFQRITSIDYKLYAQAKSIGDYSLDFSLSMILHIADQIANGQRINQQTIFQILTDVINDPKELLEITGFFDKCHDRRSLKAIPDTDPQKYELTHYENLNPRFAVYCEGRKAMKNGKPAACNHSGREFHWCENVKCYHIARQQHTDEDWENYSLADVLRILGIEFSEQQYEQLIGTVNKANRFFEHLKCRECDHILHPSGKDNYGFYRVSNFCCNNPDCNANDNIYLSHCANGKCMDIVDSRDSVRCKTEGNEDNCGWYVCNNCHACCSTKNIRSRVNRLERMGQKYNCHKEGHWDLKKLCCNKCGTEMIEYNSNYDEVLQWFLDNKETYPNITNSGINTYDKNWFVWWQGNFSREEYREQLMNIRRSGLNIPDFEDENKSTQLIAEPRYRADKKSMNYKCPGCHNELIIRKDVLPADQYLAIRKYHFERADKDLVHH